VVSADDRSRLAAPTDRVAERSFPLIAVFHLATFWAAMLACIDGAALGKILRGRWEWGWDAAIVVAALFAAMFFGAAVGLGQVRMWRSAALGAFIGVLYGPTMLAVYLAPAPITRGLAAAGLLTLTTLVFRIRAA
jgi:hypothetical protein